MAQCGQSSLALSCCSRILLLNIRILAPHAWYNWIEDRVTVPGPIARLKPVLYLDNLSPIAVSVPGIAIGDKIQHRFHPALGSGTCSELTVSNAKEYKSCCSMFLPVTFSTSVCVIGDTTTM